MSTGLFLFCLGCMVVYCLVLVICFWDTIRRWDEVD